MFVSKMLGEIRGTPLYPFTIGIFTALLGISTAYLLFPQNVGIVSVFFVSLALLPFWEKLLEQGIAHQGTAERKISSHDISLTEIRLRSRKDRFKISQILKNHNKIFRAYIFSFLGVFITYMMLEMLVSPVIATKLFGEQTVIFNISGINFGAQLASIIANNLIVLIICFLIALFYRSGVFIIAWNASVWGVVIGHTLRTSGAVDPVLFTFLNVLVILPHLTGEALSYIFAAVSGSLVFSAFVQKRKHHLFDLFLSDGLIIFLFGLIILLVSAVIEVLFAFPVIAALR